MNFNFNGSNVTINVTQAEFEKFGDVLVSGETTSPVNTYTLTDNDKYILKCILHHIRWNDTTRSLLQKFVDEG